MANFTIPADLLDIAIDRLAAAGASPSDRRDAVAILGLLACGLDAQSWATSRKGTEIAQRLGLDLARWVSIIDQLERVGLVRRVQHRGKRRLALIPPGSAPIGRPRAYPPPDSLTA